MTKEAKHVVQVINASHGVDGIIGERTNLREKIVGCAHTHTQMEPPPDMKRVTSTCQVTLQTRAQIKPGT